VNGREFIRRARRYARKTGKEWYFNPSHGKGSHGMLYVGGQRTIVPRKEIGPGLFTGMLRDLGIDKEDF
jgi:predicted RNA binding protein YcfA (HicA-like mRNA interferase family)